MIQFIEWGNNFLTTLFSYFEFLFVIPVADNAGVRQMIQALQNTPLSFVATYLDNIAGLPLAGLVFLEGLKWILITKLILYLKKLIF